MKNLLLNNAIYLEHELLKNHLNDCNVIVDATCGNGKDTYFLSKYSNYECQIYAMDIQQIALERTRKYIEEKEKDLLNKITFINANHGDESSWPNTKIDLVLFNLGYLPKGDHSIHTNFINTSRALEKAMNNLSTKGLIAIIAYPGSPQGLEETEKLEAYIKNIEQKHYNTSKWMPLNQVNNPPILYFIKGR